VKRIIIVDEQALFASAIAKILEKPGSWRVVDIFNFGEEAVKKVPLRYIDLLLLSNELPDTSGLESCRQLHRRLPSLPIFVWGNHWSPSLIRSAQAQGARGLMTKDISPAELISGVAKGLEGSTFYSSSITELLLDEGKSSGEV